jgi:hypothetical protein
LASHSDWPTALSLTSLSAARPILKEPEGESNRWDFSLISSSL